MSKREAIKIWVNGAEDSLDTAKKLLEKGKNHHALFFLHLALEKILKALYVSTKDEAPPYIHNLKQLSLYSGLNLSQKELEKLDEISEFNVSARYEEHKYNIYKKATKEYTNKWMGAGDKFYKLFKEKI